MLIRRLKDCLQKLRNLRIEKSNSTYNPEHFKTRPVIVKLKKVILQRLLNLKILKMLVRHSRNIDKDQGLKVIARFMSSVNIEFNHRPEMNRQSVNWKTMNFKDKQIEGLLAWWKNKNNLQKDVILFKTQNQCTVKRL